MLFWGTWRQHEVNATTMAPVTGMSMIWVFGIGYVTSVGDRRVHALHKLWRIATGRIADDELVAGQRERGDPPRSPRGGPA